MNYTKTFLKCTLPELSKGIQWMVFLPTMVLHGTLLGSLRLCFSRMQSHVCTFWCHGTCFANAPRVASLLFIIQFRVPWTSPCSTWWLQQRGCWMTAGRRCEALPSVILWMRRPTWLLEILVLNQHGIYFIVLHASSNTAQHIFLKRVHLDRESDRVWWHLSERLWAFIPADFHVDPNTGNRWARIEDYLDRGAGSWLWLDWAVS